MMFGGYGNDWHKIEMSIDDVYEVVHGGGVLSLFADNFTEAMYDEEFKKNFIEGFDKSFYKFAIKADDLLMNERGIHSDIALDELAIKVSDLLLPINDGGSGFRRGAETFVDLVLLTFEKNGIDLGLVAN